MLLYPLQGRAANIIRGFFYVSLAFLILGVGTVISEVLDSYPHLYGDFMGLIFVAILTLVFRFWAAYAQNPDIRNSQNLAEETPPRIVAL